MLRRKDRERAGRFLAEGPQAVREAIAAAACEVLLVDEAARGRHFDLIEAALHRGVEVSTAASSDLADLTDTVTNQGVVAVCRLPETSESAVWAGRPRLVVACADIRDPGNAGTVLRCADAFGADAVLLSRASVDPYNPKAVRASVGSVFHLPVITGADLEATTRDARAAGLQVLAADGAGESELTELEQSDALGRPTLWVLGNEAWGLAPDVAAAADVRVRVPLFGAAESLNLATAAAVCLYATATAQRRAASRTAKPVAPGDDRSLD